MSASVLSSVGFGVWGFGVSGFRFRIRVWGFRVSGLGFRGSLRVYIRSA